MGASPTSLLKGYVPTIPRIIRRAGMAVEPPRLHKICATSSILLNALAQSMVFVLAFYGFGVPFFLAATFGCGWLSFLISTRMTMEQLARIQRTYLIIHFSPTKGEHVAKGAICSSYVNFAIFMAINGLLTWFSIWPSFYKLPTSSPLFILAVACPVLFLLTIPQPGVFYFNAWINTVFGIWQPSDAACIKCYAAGLLTTLCDDSLTAAERILRMQRMYTKITRFSSRKSYGKSTLFYNAIVQCRMCLVVCASLASVVVTVPLETDEARASRIGCGLFLSLFTAIYFAMVVAGEVTMAREWDIIVREQFGGPEVARRISELGIFPTGIVGFRAWLRDAHDFRGVLFGCLRVDQVRLAQILSLFGNAVAVVFGYGVQELLL